MKLKKLLYEFRKRTSDKIYFIEELQDDKDYLFCLEYVEDSILYLDDDALELNDLLLYGESGEGKITKRLLVEIVKIICNKIESKAVPFNNSDFNEKDFSYDLESYRSENSLRL